MKGNKMLVLSGLFFGLSNCATKILGSRQSIGVSSSPFKAMIFINVQEIGLTPQSVDIKKSDSKSFKVRIELKGNKPYETVLTRKTSGWIAENILPGGVIGLAVDYRTEEAYILTPEQVEAT